VSADGGIHCLPIPTPFAVGRVNCYLIEDDPLTLVHTSGRTAACGPAVHPSADLRSGRWDPLRGLIK